MRKHQGNIAAALLWAMAALSMGTAASVVATSEAARNAFATAERPAPLSEPLFESTAVSVSPALVAALKQAGVQQMAIEPLGTSSAAFRLFVNGEPLEGHGSTATSLEQRYRLDLSGETPRIWLTERIRDTWAPALVSYYLDQELASFIEKREQRAALRKQWGRSSQS